MRILILKPSALGDVVQALPVARVLRRQFPQAELHWWVDAALSPLLEGDPDLDRLILFERTRWSVPWRWHEAVRSLRQLRTQRYDWVIDLQALARSGATAWLADGALTVGLDDPREGAPTFYDLRVPRPTFLTHAVDWYLEVPRALGVPVHWDFEWLPRRPAAAADVQRRWPADGHRWIALQPGARWLNKRWPAEHFAALVRRFAEELPDARFAVVGSGRDQALGQTLERAVSGRCLDLTGKTTLPELVEWLRRCELLIGNDSGPLHIAAALGKPVVALFGPTEPRRTGPYRQLDRVLQLPLPCVPCLSKRCRCARPLACLRDLAPQVVVDQALRALRGEGVRSPASRR